MEQNKIFFEFMGFTRSDDAGIWNAPDDWYGKDTVYTLLEFDPNDWNWLILLFGYIKGSIDKYSFDSAEYHVYESYFMELENWIADNDKQSMYDACVSYVDWYNKNLK